MGDPHSLKIDSGTKRKCSKRGFTIRGVSRGGKWTFHGPGQVVLYPIVRLGELGLSRLAAYRFLLSLRSSLSGHLLSLGLSCESHERPFGLYANRGKLTSFGIAIESGISLHGLSLYLSPQHAAFEGIHPCGVPGEKITSLEELGIQIEWEALALGVAESIKRGLNP